MKLLLLLLMFQTSEQDYERAMKALDERRWETAAKVMAEIAAKKGDKADGALYWKAYAEAKMHSFQAAEESLQALKQAYAGSRWQNDAKALQFELQQAMGGKVSPEAASDDDLKLMALNSLMNTDPERALPVLSKVINGTGSAKLKERALFVLAQGNSPKSREMLIGIAKGQSNPDLQKRAVRNLAINASAENRKALAEIYGGSADAEVKREVIRAYLICGDKTTLASLAKTEKQPELRREAIQTLGMMGDQQTLLDMYGPESDAGVKKTILNGLFLSGASGKLVELARQEKDLTMKRDIVQKLSMMKSKEATDYMLELLNK